MATLIIAGYTALGTASQAYALCVMRYLGILLLPYLNYYRCKLQVDGVISKKHFDGLSAGLRSIVPRVMNEPGCPKRFVRFL